MAAITSAQSGNWSAVTTWVGGVVPGNGDTVTISAGHTIHVDVNTTVGTSPASGGAAALVQNGPLIVDAGVAFIVRGPVTLGNAGVTFEVGSTIVMDASQATDPTAQKYAWTSNAYVRGNRLITSNGTSGSPVTIMSDAAGGNGYFHVAGGYSDSLWTNATYTDFVRIGDNVNSAIKFNPSTDTTVNVLSHCSFDSASGAVEWLTTHPLGGGYDIQDTKFLQTNAKTQGTGHKNSLILKTNSSGTITGTRKLYRNVFMEMPNLVGRGLDAQDNYFHRGWDDNNGGWNGKWVGMSGAFTRLTTNSGYSHAGDISISFVLFDTESAPSYTGTAKGAQSGTTLQDTTKSWATDVFSVGAVSTFIEITGGTGVGQRRLIKANTANAVTVAYRWDTQPDSTSTYSIVADIYNNHGLQPASAITSGTITLDTVLWQSTGTDTQGDCWLHLDANGATYRMTKNIVLPNGMGDSTGTPLTMFTSNQAHVSLDQNTWFMGAQAVSLSEQTHPATAGIITSLKNNIGWVEPGRAATPPSSDSTHYYAHGGAYGPYLIVDTSAPVNPGLGTQDLVVSGSADYNNIWGLLAGIGKSYQINTSTAPGAHDLNVDPQFVDKTVSFWTWAVSIGSTSVSMAGKIADGLAYLQADPTLTRTSLVPYIQAGFAPRNSALATAGYGGTYIGAVDVVASVDFYGVYSAVQAAQSQLISSVICFDGYSVQSQTAQDASITSSLDFLATVAQTQKQQEEAIYQALLAITGAVSQAQAAQIASLAASLVFGGSSGQTQYAQVEALAAVLSFASSTAQAQTAQTEALTALLSFGGDIGHEQAIQIEALTAIQSTMDITGTMEQVQARQLQVATNFVAQIHAILRVTACDPLALRVTVH